jgi:hypothetical protein
MDNPKETQNSRMHTKILNLEETLKIPEGIQKF